MITARTTTNHLHQHRAISPLFMLAALAFLFALPWSARAAGLLIADGGLGGVLTIEEHRVNVTINNGIAVTEVTQVFRNTEKRQVEALYTFPIPKGASVSNFSMWINGKEMVGEVVEKKRARQIYNSYKQKRRDPGLLEQKDYKTFEMRIFPINAGARQQVQIVYYQELNMDHDWGTYVYPLSTVTRPEINSKVSGAFTFNADIKSEIPVSAIESPSHGDRMATVHHGRHYVQASLEEAEGRLDRDIVLAYNITRPKTGIDLITSRRNGEDGFFSLTLTAGEDLKRLDKGMDYVFVLDISGSMKDQGKLELSTKSLAAFINALGEKDRFELITFNIRPNTLFRSLTKVTPDTQKQATDYFNSRTARGGTRLRAALEAAYKYVDQDRALNVVILSDGLTENKERRVLLDMIRARPAGVRVFSIGVGNEVDHRLLEQMAQDTGGLAHFISRGDDFDRQAKAFRRKLMHPVATDLTLAFDGVQIYDLEPKTVPNLYHGSPVRVYGRYSGSGDAGITLAGNIGGKAMKRDLSLNFPKSDGSNPEIERMWASKRVDQMLKAADRGGNRAGAIDEIVLLGEGFSIVTEYTSFLVLENDAEYKRWRIDRRNMLRIKRDRSAQADVQQRLEALRAKANMDIGPVQTRTQPLPDAAPMVATRQSKAPGANPQPRSNPRPQRNWDMDFDFGGGGGGGPVGPLFLLAMVGMAAARRRRRGSSV